MFISVFDLFRPGIGPSSSHTVGPMRAAGAFLRRLATLDVPVDRIQVTLLGSLAATGLGHATDRAVLLGLMGYKPDSIDPKTVDGLLKQLETSGALDLAIHPDAPQRLAFNLEHDIVFDFDAPCAHPNTLAFTAFSDGKPTASCEYYSVGGGFILDEDQSECASVKVERHDPPYPFASAEGLLMRCRESGLSISGVMLANEQFWQPEADISAQLHTIWDRMHECITNGLARDGLLPGGLDVPRRAARLFRSLNAAPTSRKMSAARTAMDWINLYALAVNEENAAGGRVVTAPTNGAAGIIPAVLNYYMTFEADATAADIPKFLLTAGAIGILCKTNASISGAEVGCQGEVGSACAMAAAGLAEILGGTPEQAENAAEIGLEHNLGLTCDPIGGLVQVPCIERNAIAAVKAVNAAQMALRNDGTHFVSLDRVIRTMRDTGRDMSDKYKETSRGGLAVSQVEC